MDNFARWVIREVDVLKFHFARNAFACQQQFRRDVAFVREFFLVEEIEDSFAGRKGALKHIQSLRNLGEWLLEKTDIDHEGRNCA